MYNTPLTKHIHRCTAKYTSLWRHTPLDISTVLTLNTIDEQRIKEEQVSASIDRLSALFKDRSITDENKAATRERLQHTIVYESRSLLRISNKELENKLLTDFFRTAEEFFEETKSFDSSLKPTDVFQALRNVWIMNLIQLLTNLDINHTPSIFAYSMLYPYTDNFLDDDSVSKESKKAFNRRLGLRLAAADITPTNTHEEKVYALIAMIETQYPRTQYPQVYDGLLAIHTGQCKSLNQQLTDKNTAQEILLSISAEKGGTSVLADGYLVCGDLCESLFEFTFAFGFILQLIDDLQDVQSDFDAGSNTLFVATPKGKLFDDLTRRLIVFTCTTLDFDCIHTPYTDALKTLILENCLLLIFEAVAKNRRYYTKSFLNELQSYSSIRFRKYKSFRRNFHRQTKSVDWELFY